MAARSVPRSHHSPKRFGWHPLEPSTVQNPVTGVSTLGCTPPADLYFRAPGGRHENAPHNTVQNSPNQQTTKHLPPENRSLNCGLLTQWNTGEQESASFSYQRPDSEYFRLCRPQAASARQAANFLYSPLQTSRPF